MERDNTYPNVARHCAACGSKRLANAKFCSECGTPFPQERHAGPEIEMSLVEQTSMAQAPPDTSAQASANTEPVPATIPAPDSIPHESESTEQAGCRTCSSCGQALPQEVLFCSACGTKVAAQQDVCLQLSRKASNYPPIPLVKDILKIGNAADCDIRLLDDAYVSRSHAQLVTRDGKVFVEDLGSSNGTFIRVNRPMELEPGNELIIGTTAVWLEAINRSDSAEEM